MIVSFVQRRLSLINQMSKQFKLDIFDVLGQIDSGNMSYYDNLSDELKKSFTPLLVHQWMCGNASKDQLLMLDTFVNTQIFNLYKNPELLYKLMVCSSDSNPKRYKYLKRKKKVTTPTVTLQTISEYYGCSLRDAKMYYNTMDVEDVKEMGEELGYNKDIIKKIK